MAQRRIARAPGAEARQRHHQHCITRAQLAAAPADLLLGPKALGPFSPRSRTEEVAATDGVEAMRTATQTPEQRYADVVAAQEFYQIQKFVAACRRQWPGAKIGLRPNHGVASIGADAPINPKPGTRSRTMSDFNDDPRHQPQQTLIAVTAQNSFPRRISATARFAPRSPASAWKSCDSKTARPGKSSFWGLRASTKKWF